VRSACGVHSGVCAAYCSVASVERDVNCLSWTLVGRASEFVVELRDHCRAPVDDVRALTVCQRVQLLCTDVTKYVKNEHTFNDPLSRTTRVSRYQKGKTNLDFTEARDSDWQWRQLGCM